MDNLNILRVYNFNDRLKFLLHCVFAGCYVGKSINICDVSMGPISGQWTSTGIAKAF